MRILVGWDKSADVNLIEMYLSVDDNVVEATTDIAQFVEMANGDANWDVILMSQNLADQDATFEAFQRVRELQGDAPIIGACYQQDVFQIVRYMTRGMSAYVIRDQAGNYIFLLQAILESAVEAVQAERERQVAVRLREEVESVRKLQETVIPANLQAPDGYQISGRYEPSQIQVVGGRPVTLAGGDYYDVFALDDDHVVLLVGDASGHGMKAAMSIMTMHTLVRMIRTQAYRNTAQFVHEINNQLVEHSLVNDEGGFITLLYAILDVKKEELQWTSAGHPIPMLQDLATGDVHVVGPDDAGGLPLAIIPDADYETHTTPIPANSRILFCTDGLEEAFPEKATGKHIQFGIDGIIESMKQTTNQSLEEAIEALFDDSNAFTQGSGRHDDTSVVLLQRS